MLLCRRRGHLAHPYLLLHDSSGCRDQASLAEYHTHILVQDNTFCKYIMFFSKSVATLRVCPTDLTYIFNDFTKLLSP